MIYFSPVIHLVEQYSCQARNVSMAYKCMKHELTNAGKD